MKLSCWCPSYCCWYKLILKIIKILHILIAINLWNNFLYSFTTKIMWNFYKETGLLSGSVNGKAAVQLRPLWNRTVDAFYFCQTTIPFKILSTEGKRSFVWENKTVDPPSVVTKQALSHYAPYPLKLTYYKNLNNWYTLQEVGLKWGVQK